MPKSIYGMPPSGPANGGAAIDIRPQLDKIIDLNLRVGSIMTQIQNSKSIEEKGILMKRVNLMRNELLMLLGRPPAPDPDPAPAPAPDPAPAPAPDPAPDPAPATD